MIIEGVCALAFPNCQMHFFKASSIFSSGQVDVSESLRRETVAHTATKPNRGNNIISFTFFTLGRILWMPFVSVYTFMALNQAWVKLTCQVFKCRIYSIWHDAYGFVSFFIRKENGNISSAFFTDTILGSIFSLYIQPSYSSYLDDQRRGSQSNIVSYPLGHLNNSRSERGNSRNNNRNRNQSRDRYRNNDNRSQGNRGSSNQGPGILGAKPGDRSVPELPSNPLQGLM